MLFPSYLIHTMLSCKNSFGCWAIKNSCGRDSFIGFLKSPKRARMTTVEMEPGILLSIAFDKIIN